MPPVVNMDLCNGCKLCDLLCPIDVIHMVGKEPEIRYPDECWYCGVCRQDCPKDAIHYEFAPIMLAV